ncbi:MAG: hypothetical protein LBG58_12990 [Planctomycetaceae bacterium]|nr:hypothetical protein [Planctomycetaceae bacterium]
MFHRRAFTHHHVDKADLPLFPVGNRFPNRSETQIYRKLTAWACPALLTSGKNSE